MSQSPLFKYTESIDYLGDFPGAERERDRLKVMVAAGAVDLTDRAERAIGNVTVDGTPIEDALAAEGLDHLLVGQAEGEVFTVAQNAPVEVGTWSAGTLTVDQANALTVGTWNAGTLAVQEDTPLDVSGATVPVSHQDVIDVSSRDGRNLGDVDVTALPDSDFASENATALASGGTVSNSLAASGSDTLRGRVVRASTSYDVEVDWEDSNGNVLFTDSVASGVIAGTETSLNEKAISPYCTVRVVDAGAASGAVTASFHLR